MDGRGYHQGMSPPTIDIDKLAPEERLRLIGDLWESLRATPEAAPITQAQRDELDRRLDDLERGTGDSVFWSDITRRLDHRSA
jgi:putative addiction module component (TIGR02574 family)